jgi:excisionase family DNA binding protein
LTDVLVFFAERREHPREHASTLGRSRLEKGLSTMAANRPEITGRATNTNPLAVTVQQACELSGLGPTSIWAFLKDGRLEAVRVPGVRRTLIRYASLERLLAPPSDSPSPPKSRRRGRALQGASEGEER